MPLRVISGSAGGLRLKSPKRHVLRPTQDRIRQVIFSSLAERIPDASVLDLYAGTGSFGIEALSRGAVSACFVEQDREAVECIRENLTHCRLTGDVRCSSVETFFQSGPSSRFTLIFADPPYDKREGSLDAHPLLREVAKRLAPDGLFVWEHYAEQRLQSPADWEIVRHKTYGETGLSFLCLLDRNRKISL